MTPTTPPPTTGQRLKQLREDRGLTRQQVYDQMRDQFGEGLAPSTLEKWESDLREPRATLAANLARIYDVTLDYVFLLVDNPDGHRIMDATELDRRHVKINPTEEP